MISEHVNADDAVMDYSCPCCRHAIMAAVDIVCQTCDAYHQGIWGTENEKLDATYEQEQDQARWETCLIAALGMHPNVIAEMIENAGKKLSLFDIAKDLYIQMNQGPPKGEQTA